MNSRLLKCLIRRNQFSNIHLIRNYTYLSAYNPENSLLTRHEKLPNQNLVRSTFWEREKKSGYGKMKEGQIMMPNKKMILDGLKELKNEIALWKEEIKDKFESDPLLVFRPGEIDVAWKFKEQVDMDKWVVTADSDHNEGYSKANFEISPAGHGLFYGNLQSAAPKDGRIKKAGYCNIRSMRARVSNLFFFFVIW
jgi:NADH dehydrogenase [ubiquinone] 1 alpha subcomplex assembly factor 1